MPSDDLEFMGVRDRRVLSYSWVPPILTPCTLRKARKHSPASTCAWTFESSDRNRLIKSLWLAVGCTGGLVGDNWISATMSHPQFHPLNRISPLNHYAIELAQFRQFPFPESQLWRVSRETAALNWTFADRFLLKIDTISQLQLFLLSKQKTFLSILSVDNFSITVWINKIVNLHIHRSIDIETDTPSDHNQ